MLARTIASRQVHETPVSQSVGPHTPSYLCPQAILLRVDKHGHIVKESQDGPTVAELGGQGQQTCPHFRPGWTSFHQDPANQLAAVPQRSDLWETRSSQQGPAPALS